VGFILIFIKLNKFLNKFTLNNQIIETIWTLIPTLVLVQISIPSLIILYSIDDIYYSSLSIKTIGHQWYWRYEYSDFWSKFNNKLIQFDSYIKPIEELDKGSYRLLETDNSPVLPITTQIRILVRRSDVLHSWTVPRLGVKIDATPGRLNQLKIFRHRPGVFYGQCSEICGANHRFIPISLEFVNIEVFLKRVLYFN
jgi:cytochrome c oxidase subunit 2